MFKCNDCGNLFEEGEQKKFCYQLGEYGGVPCFEAEEVCPCCDGSFDEAEACLLCGTYGELSDDGICNYCLSELRRNRKKKRNIALDYSKSEEFYERL